MGGSPIANSVKVFSLEISLYMELSFCIVAIKIGGGGGGVGGDDYNCFEMKP